MFFVIKMCSDYTWSLYLVCMGVCVCVCLSDPPVFPRDGIDVSIVFKPKWTDLCQNVCETNCCFLEHITVASTEWESSGGRHPQGAETFGLFCTGVCGDELFGVCLFLPSLHPFYCSALYDNVVFQPCGPSAVHRALFWAGLVAWCVNALFSVSLSALKMN